MRSAADDARASVRAFTCVLFLAGLTGAQLLYTGRWLGLEGAQPRQWLAVPAALLLTGVGLPLAALLAMAVTRICARQLPPARILLTAWLGAVTGGLLLLRGGPWLAYTGALVGCVTAVSLAGLYAASRESLPLQSRRFPV